jgi:EAL domain-containing protein (putative c-di-GMP-specific phosphodiesterase class I)
MVALVRDELESTGADPRDIVFELSETQLTEALDSGSAFVNAIAELGCQIALDGFVEGGPGSFLLRRFPIGYVKLGAPFIEGLADDRSKRRSVTTAVIKAHRSGQRVIAQGVETLATLQVLEGLEVDEAQGHALGPPESLESLTGATA